MLFPQMNWSPRWSLCSASENDVTMNRKITEEDDEVDFSVKPHPTANFTSSILTSLDLGEIGYEVEDESNDDQELLVPWILSSSSTSRSTPQSKGLTHCNSEKSIWSNPWTKLSNAIGDEDDAGKDMSKPGRKARSFANILRPTLLRGKASRKRSSMNLSEAVFDATAHTTASSFETKEGEPIDELRQIPPSPVGTESTNSTQEEENREAEIYSIVPSELSMQFETPEEEIIFEDEEEGTEVVPMSPITHPEEQLYSAAIDCPLVPNGEQAEMLVQDGSGQYFLNPPVLEISHQHRGRISSDLSDVSQMSSLSGSRHNALEYSLERGFEGTNKSAPFLMAVSEAIVRRLEQKEQTRVQVGSTQSTASSRCLILLMDPKKRIFELVQVPYQAETTTVGDMLEQLPSVATDHRLARMNYTGVAYEGIHVSAPMVPVDIIWEAQSAGKPLFAVPEGYTAGQIEVMGTSLLRSPNVKQLLDSQLAMVETTNPTKCPTSQQPSASKSTTMLMSSRPGHGVPANRFSSETSGRHLKSSPD